MKKIILAALIVSMLVFAGCTGKADKNVKGGSANNGTSVNIQNSGNSDPAPEQRVEVQADFKPVDPGTVPQLSTQQKNELGTKLNTTLENVDKALKSIQDPKEIDLTSVN